MLEIPAVRRIRCSRPASATEWIQDQPELPDTLYKKEKKKLMFWQAALTVVGGGLFNLGEQTVHDGVTSRLRVLWHPVRTM